MDASTDVPSSSSQPTYGLRPRSLPPIDHLGFPSTGAVVLEPTSYRDVVVHPEWQFAMAEDIAALERHWNVGSGFSSSPCSFHHL